MPRRAQLPSPLIIPGGLVLCSWIKPYQLSLTLAKLPHEARAAPEIRQGGNLMSFKRVPRQVCTEWPAFSRDSGGTGQGGQAGFLLRYISMFGRERLPMEASLFLSHGAGDFYRLGKRLGIHKLRSYLPLCGAGHSE